MFTVLFTSVGRRVELVQAFKNSYQEKNIQARVIGTDANPQLAPAGYYTDAVFQVPRVKEALYGDTLLEICRREKVNLLIPLYEPEFLILDKYRSDLARFGTFLMLSPRETLEICADKYQTYNFFKNNKFTTPQTWLVKEKRPSDSFPLFVKPRTGMGSSGAQKADSQTELNFLLNQNPELIVQEYISGREFTLDALSDLNGQVLSVVPRERLEVRSGEVVKSRTADRPDLLEQGKRIVETLGAIGPVTIQCIDDGRMVYWIEVNPRFGGGVPLSIRAGVDYPFLLYRMYNGEPLQPILGEYQINLTMLRYDQAVYF